MFNIYNTDLIPTNFSCTYDGPLHRQYRCNYLGYFIGLEFEKDHWDITVTNPYYEDFLLLYSVTDIPHTLDLVFKAISLQVHSSHLNPRIK